MPGVSLSILNAVMKEFYLPPVVEQLNNEVLLLQRLEARDQELVGKAAFVPLHTGRSGGIGARGEYILLPEAGAQAYARAEYVLKYHRCFTELHSPREDSDAQTRKIAGLLCGTL